MRHCRSAPAIDYKGAPKSDSEVPEWSLSHHLLKRTRCFPDQVYALSTGTRIGALTTPRQRDSHPLLAGGRRGRRRERPELCHAKMNADGPPVWHSHPGWTTTIVRRFDRHRRRDVHRGPNGTGGAERLVRSPYGGTRRRQFHRDFRQRCQGTAWDEDDPRAGVPQSGLDSAGLRRRRPQASEALARGPAPLARTSVVTRKWASSGC